MIGLSQVLKATAGISNQNIEEFCFTGINTDSRTIKQGELFIALHGENFDGHGYCTKALAAGAAAVLVEKKIVGLPEDALIIKVEDTLKAYQAIAHAYRMSLPHLKVIAVTGSNGKTSTKDLISACLASKYKVVKTEANFNNEIGLPKTLLSIKKDTEIAVVEMGMRGLGQIRALKKIAQPDIAVITNIGETHMEILGSMENIAKAKSEILEGFTAENIAVLNDDDVFIRQMTTKAERLTYGLQEPALVRAENIITTGKNTTFIYVSKLTGIKQEVVLPLVGVHNVFNALAAIAIAEKFGIADSTIAETLAHVVLTGKRQEIIQQGAITIINDAYNASPASMEAALQTLHQVGVAKGAKTRTIAVLADMLELGAASAAAHARVGEYVSREGIDFLITYGEQAKYIVQAAQAKGVDAVHCPDQNSAAAILKNKVQAGDVILFKGSHSMEVDKIITMVFNNK